MTRVFEKSPIPPPVGSTDFSLHLWDDVRNAGIEPQFSSSLDETPEKRLEFLRGAELMGFRLEPFDPEARARELLDPLFAAERNRERRAAGYRSQLLPQQLRIADCLNLEHDSYAIEIPRRATKTTSIFMVGLGRMASRPDYQVTFSAQNGVAGSRRLREWAQRLDQINPPDDLDLPPWLRGQNRRPKAVQRHEALFGEDLLAIAEQAAGTSGRGFRIMRGEVGKGIYFDNGSQMLVLKPDGDAYRGEAADLSWLDEFQEVDPVEGDDVIAAILPLQDTKPGASLVVSGTAGEARIGPFWSYIARLRAHDADVGGMDYAAPEDTAFDDIEDEDAAIRLLEGVHPGIGTLTTTEKMRKNHRGMSKPQWAREYLSMWPDTMGVAAIPAGWWETARLERRPRIPERVAFGLDVRPGGSVAAICAAWRDGRGTAYVEVIAHQPSTSWVPQKARELMKYSGATIAYDDIGEGKATATELEAMRPKPRLRVQTYREHAAGCVQLLRELERGTLKHFGQAGLDDAVATATKREVRSDNGVWLWGVGANGGDISTLVAATRALRNWDQHFARKGTSTVGIVAA
jgi:hypothetical protein